MSAQVTMTAAEAAAYVRKYIGKPRDGVSRKYKGKIWYIETLDSAAMKALLETVERQHRIIVGLGAKSAGAADDALKIIKEAQEAGIEETT